MKIVLLRHGKPDIPRFGKLRASELHRWIDAYNSAGIMKVHQPSREAIEISHKCNAVVCSDLPRSVESAVALRIRQINHIDPLFREMGLPYPHWPSPKLPPNIWAALFRFLWFFGYSSHAESIRAAKRRAASGVDKLKELAYQNDSVLLVGHGFVNRYISKSLLSSSWHGPASPGKKYWEFGVYEYEAY